MQYMIFFSKNLAKYAFITNFHLLYAFIFTNKKKGPKYANAYSPGFEYKYSVSYTIN